MKIFVSSIFLVMTMAVLCLSPVFAQYPNPNPQPYPSDINKCLCQDNSMNCPCRQEECVARIDGGYKWVCPPPTPSQPIPGGGFPSCGNGGGCVDQRGQYGPYPPVRLPTTLGGVPNSSDPDVGGGRK